MAALAVCTPVLAQTSPFLTGATALQSNILAWLTPIAIILVMVLRNKVLPINQEAHSSRFNGLGVLSRPGGRIYCWL